MGDSPRLLVVGVGNTILMDDGIGVRLVEAISSAQNVSVDVCALGTDFMTLLHYCDYTHWLVVDAMELGRAPGSWAVMDWHKIDHSRAVGSLHAFGIADMLNMFEIKPDVTLFGIQPDQIDLGTILSPTLEHCFQELRQALEMVIVQMLTPLS